MCRSGDGDVLERLRRLEAAVFGDKHSHTRTELNNPPETLESLHSSRLSGDPSEELDYGHADDVNPSDYYDEMIFRIREIDSPLQDHDQSSPRCIWLPNRILAVTLLEDYLSSSYHFLPAVIPASTRTTLADLYDRISQNQVATLGSAALILSIAATSAFHWTDDGSSMQCFNSVDDAAKTGLAWRKSAWTLLDQTQRSTSRSLEDVQATVILCDLFYNVEGCSGNFRTLHNQSVCTAREMSLHLVDAQPERQTGDDEATKEAKRRVWWHIVSTDW